MLNYDIIFSLCLEKKYIIIFALFILKLGQPPLTFLELQEIDQ
jgi:hypothetical protein